ncbi:MAG TPA: hypothetical protein VKZ63_19070 [Kofleriaceae bacterium]|nr:hypothetical protein [Kofleriaceae bacterium]
MRRWLVRGALGLAAAYAVLLVGGGVALRGCVEQRARERLARALGAEVSIGSTSFSLRRGEIVFEDVVASREDGGALELQVGRVDVKVAGWGAALVDSDVDRVVVRRAALALSARGAVELARREREPVPIGGLVIEDASLAVMPSALLPGLGRIEIELGRAETGPIDLGGALSWIEAVRWLQADVSAPGGIRLTGLYREGELNLAGSLFGSEPIQVPLRFPDLEPGASELEVLSAVMAEVMRAGGAAIAREVAEEAAIDRVRSWVDVRAK